MVGKDCMTVFRKYMHKHSTMDYPWIMSEKKETTVFPWDFIETGISKPYLLKEWRAYKDAVLNRSCFVHCSQCGADACDVDHIVSTFNKKRRNRDAVTFNIDKIKAKRKAPVQRLRLQFTLKPMYRYIDATKVKMHLRRACFRAKLPITDDFALASDRLVFQAWIHGCDYAEVKTKDKCFMSPDAIVTALNKELFAMKVERADLVPEAMASNFRELYDRVVYSTLIPKHAYGQELIESKIAEFQRTDNFPVKVKVKGDMRDTWKTIVINAREHAFDIWSVDRGEFTELRFMLNDTFNPYDMTSALLQTSRRNALGWPTKRLYFLAKKTAAEVDDMFAVICEKSNLPVEREVFGEHISDKFSARWAHLGDKVDLREEAGLIAVDRGEAAEEDLPSVYAGSEGGDESRPEYEVNREE
jgi:hypothetical protein